MNENYSEAGERTDNFVGKINLFVERCDKASIEV